MTRQFFSEPISSELGQRITHLKQRLVGFQVVTVQGDIVGFVKDLIVDEDNRLNLLIQKKQSSDSFLIKTQLIQQVHPRSRTLSIPNFDSAMTTTPDYSDDAFGTVIIQQDDRISSVDHSLEDQPIPGKALSPDVIQEETIQLLEERLRVAYQKQKVGEVIVRKVIETELVSVPVRREKLIVEQVSPDHRQLAEIDLGQGDIPGLELIDHAQTDLTVTGEFSSPKTVAWLLDAIARQRNHGCRNIRITLELQDTEHVELYQSWFDRSSNSRTNGH